MIDQPIFHICKKKKCGGGPLKANYYRAWTLDGFWRLLFCNRNKFAIPDNIRRFLRLDTTLIVAILSLSTRGYSTLHYCWPNLLNCGGV